MPSIHPSESPELGWLVPCLAVKDLKASLDWYAALDLLPYGGDPAEGWSMLRNRAVEIHLFQGHIDKDCLNFRGGEPAEIRAALSVKGLEPGHVEGERSFAYFDPDGRHVFIDSGPDEVVAYQSGQPLTAPIPDADIHAGDGMDLGNFTCCLNCKDLPATSKFYKTLGFVFGGGQPESGWEILVRPDHMHVFGQRLATTSLSVFQGMIPADTLNFRGGNVAAIAKPLGARGIDLKDGVVTSPDGGEYLQILDPDERPILFDTTPPERLYEA